MLMIVVGTPHQVNQMPHIWKGIGTTTNFSNILLKLCSFYIHTRKLELRNKNCSQIVEAFMSAFLSRDPCEVTEQDYTRLLQLTKQRTPCGRVLLWSKTRMLVTQYWKQRKDIYVLEKTLLGHMIEDLIWCGDQATSEINYVSCPDEKNDCQKNAISVLWDVA